MLNEKHIEKTEYEAGVFEMIYDEIIHPFLEHFIALFINIVPKLFVLIIAISSGILQTGIGLFATPMDWVYGITILVSIDFISGTFRAAIEPDITFSLKKNLATAFKIGSYSLALISVTVATNMFPTALGWLQYITFALLTANEIYSILNNLKLTALADVFYDLIISRTLNGYNGKALMSEINKRSLDSFRKKQDKKFNRYKEKPPK